MSLQSVFYLIVTIVFILAIFGFVVIVRFFYKSIREGKGVSWTKPIETDLVSKDGTKLIEENKAKGIFGPTKMDKLGGSIAYGFLILILNFIVFNAPNEISWWFFILFNLFWGSLIYLAFFRVNVYVKNGELLYRPEFKKHTALVSEITSVKRIYASGYRGMPTPILSLEIPGRKSIEVSIQNWPMPAIIAFIKYLKEINKEVLIDKVFDPLLSANSSIEFKAAQKAYSKQETGGLLKFGITALASMAFFYILWLLANHFKD